MLQLPTQPWTLATCSSQDRRDQLASFWLAAPEDLLPSLWSSPAGEVTRSMIRSLTSETVFTPEQVSFRNQVGQRLASGLDSPGAIQLLIANFLYSPPGLMKIANADSQLPHWLLPEYKNIYEQSPQVVGEIAKPVQSQHAENVPSDDVPAPDFGVFPSTLQELVGNRVQLNRLLGLSNLYYIDPEDKEILNELRQVRLSLIDAIECCPESDLEGLWATDFGDRYWSLVRSGVQKEALSPVEEQKKHSVTSKLNPASGGGFGQPGAINAVLIAMTLFEPGTMQINNAEQQLPGWVLTPYKQIFAHPQVQE